jgi:hypothetical protein
MRDEVTYFADNPHENWVEVYLPFGGFYESWASDRIERAIESIYCDSQGEPLMGKVADYWQRYAFDHTKIRAEYVRVYAEEFFDWCATSANFKTPYELTKLYSPSEYNFHTDEIAVRIPRATVRALYSRVKGDSLDERIAYATTPRDGFSPFVRALSNDESSDLPDWNASHLTMLFDQLVEDYHGNEDAYPFELSLMDDRCDAINEAAWAALEPDELKRVIAARKKADKAYEKAAKKG